MNNFKILLMVILSAISVFAFGQNTKNEKYAQKEKIAAAVKKAVYSSNIEISVDRVITEERQVNDIAGDYYLIIRNDSLICYLPFFGDPGDMSAVLPGQNRMELKEQKVSLIRTNPRPGIYVIKFSNQADMGLDTFNFIITIFESSFCQIRLFPLNGDNITYQGNIKY